MKTSGITSVPSVPSVPSMPSVELVLPTSDEEEWAFISAVLSAPLDALADLDTVLTTFADRNSERESHVCTFFASVPGSPDHKAAGGFDFERFFALGVPLMVQVALDMPALFPDSVAVPVFKMRSSWPEEQRTLGRQSVALTRRQCACLLAHSFFGSLRRPADIQPNDFRFTATELFMGTAVSPNSATTFLNYFSVLGERGFPGDGGGSDGGEGKEEGGGATDKDMVNKDMVVFERLGYRKGAPPWQWVDSDKPLCACELLTGSIDDCEADTHAEFANAYVRRRVTEGWVNKS